MCDRLSHIYSVWRLIASTTLVVILAACAFSQKSGWLDVPQEDIDLKAPRVEPDADAEVLFWEVRIADEYQSRAGFKSVRTNYVRIKIFTDRGRDDYNKVSLEYGRSRDLGFETSLKDIAARTIKPDGSILEVKPADIFDNETRKGDGDKLRSKSFVMPGLEAGSIIEYRWRETVDDALSYYIRLQLAREIPIQFVKYYVRPVAAPNFRLGMRVHSINTDSGFQKEKDGYYSTTMRNVPSFKEESFMPAEDEVRPWVLVFYDDDGAKTPPAEYWRDTGIDSYKDHESLLESNTAIRQAAIEASAGATDDIDKVRRIYDFCRRSITNVYDDASGLKPEELAKWKPNRKTAEVLSRKMGDWHDIEMLFGSMVSSLGFTARVARVSSRHDPKFDRTLANRYFIRREVIAVKVAGKWIYCDASSRYLPFGMLPWNVEGQTALISDPENPIFDRTPVSAPSASAQNRKADLKLSEDGTLEGEVRLQFTGHVARYYKELYDDLSQNERERRVIALIKGLVMDTAELSAISIDGIADIDQPVVLAFHLRIPSYSVRTGKRMLLLPDIFVRNTKPGFAKTARRFDISFNYAWTEADEVNVEIPEGYEPESVEVPVKLDDGHANIFQNVSYSFEGRTLKFKSNFSLGDRSVLELSKYEYPSMRALFDSIHQAKSQGVMLLKRSSE